MKITDIKVPKRYRSNYVNIESLAISIVNNGLFNPIIITQDNNLNQGGRRLSAMRLIYEVAQENPDFELDEETTTILLSAPKGLLKGNLVKDTHYRVMHINDRHQELICELEENFQREGITWQDRAKLIRAIHTEYQELHGKSDKSGAGWSFNNTSKHLNLSPATLSHDFRLAEALESEDEDIIGAKDRASALKIIIAKAEEKVNAEIHKRESARLAEFSSSHRLYNMDAIECVESLTKGDFTHVITDPPYAIELDKLTQVKECDDYLEFTKAQYIPYMLNLSRALYEKMTAGYFVCFCAHEHYHILAKAIESVGFKISSVPLIWYKKGSPTKNHHPDRQLSQQQEYAVVAWKSLTFLNAPGKGNVFEYTSHIDIALRFHITQKPVELMKDIINTFTKPSEVILDCFIGSGSTIKACLDMKRGFIGCDKSEYFEDTKLSIMQHKQAEK